MLFGTLLAHRTSSGRPCKASSWKPEGRGSQIAPAILGSDAPRRRSHLSGRVPRPSPARAHAAHPCALPALHLAQHHHPPARGRNLCLSLSDLLEGAPESVLHAIAHILLAKLYRKPIDPAHNLRYKRFASSAAVTRQTDLIRTARGSKRFFGPEGRYFHLDEVFDSLNTRFFGGLLGRPDLTWSEHHAKRSLGHYDAAHNTIVVSRVFDRPSSPRYAIEYLLYHEMLHLKHPVRTRGLRRCVHSREFKAEEARFPQLAEALAFIKRLS